MFAIVTGTPLKYRPFAIVCALCPQNVVTELLGGFLPTKMILVNSGTLVQSVGEIFMEDSLSACGGVLLTCHEKVNYINGIKICWPLLGYCSIAAGWLNLDGNCCGWWRGSI